MKSNYKSNRSYLRLPPKEKAAIDNVITEYITDQLNREEAELQKIWIKLACIVLHDAFGFGKQRLTTFIGNWKRIYRRNKKINGYDEQTEFLKSEMDRIFGEGECPNEFIDKLEDI